MRFLKRLAVSLAVFGLLFSHPGLSSAANPPTITYAEAEEPIVSSDGYDIQTARVIVHTPGGPRNTVKSVSIIVTSPNVSGHAMGVFTFNLNRGFFEYEGPRSGNELVNLLPVNTVDPTQGSQWVYDQQHKDLELAFRWTLNDDYGSILTNDIEVRLATKNNVAANLLMLQPVMADSSTDIVDAFDSNSPPDAEPISDVDVIAGQDEVDVTLMASDVDADPITYLMISAPAEAEFNVDTFSWLPSIDDVGTRNVQFVAADPYGITTISFNVNVEEEPIPEGGSWVPVSDVDAPSARLSATNVWSGEEVLMWGGLDAQGATVGSGGRYNPTTDTWTSMAPALNDFAALGHAAVWTGDRMIVWGGTTPSGITNEGQIYDPATDSWTAMSTVDAPSPRYDAVGAWAGGKFVVWGGADDVGRLSDGAVYDIATDSWTAMSASPLEARQSVGAGAFGDKVIMWGGSDFIVGQGNVVYDDGAVYDVVTDSWVEMSTAEAPTPRGSSAAVSGSEDTLLIWGGIDANGNMLNTGAVYQLSTDTWTAMATDQAPEPRTGPMGAGSNGTIIIWGGFNDEEGAVSTGGIYDEPSGTWLSTPMLNAPSARQSAKPVWTSQGMFIWGGIGNGGAFSNTGAIFVP